MIKEWVDEASRDRMWLIRFVQGTAQNPIQITIHRYGQEAISLGQAIQLTHELAVITWIMFRIDVDLSGLRVGIIEQFEEMFGALLQVNIRLTFDLKGPISFDSLPVHEIRGKVYVDIAGQRGFSGNFGLVKWFGKTGKRLHKLNVNYMHWRYVDDIPELYVFYLVIAVIGESNYLKTLRELYAASFRRFLVQLVDAGGTTIAEWEKVRTFVDGHHRHSLHAIVSTQEQATQLVKFLLLRRPLQLDEIDVRVKSQHDVFFAVYQRLRFALDPFNRYTVRETSADGDDINVVQVIGDALIMKLSGGRFIFPPAGARFTSIDLMFGRTVPVLPSQAAWLADWLTTCDRVKKLRVIEYQARTVANAIKLIVLDKVRETGESMVAISKWAIFLAEYMNINSIARQIQGRNGRAD